jgi:Protein of unknown function (DUF3168)
MVVEAQRVAGFVFDTLKADSAFNTAIGGRLYRDQVPQAATLPAGIVSVVAATDVGTLGAVRVMDQVLVDVHLIASGASYAPINGAADRADAVLQNTSGASGGVVVVELRREQTTLYLENESGTTFSHIVQSFRSEAYQAPP